MTAGDWRLAGELEIGEEVLTKEGEATVICSERQVGREVVYNLEVKGLHNFLVGESGVLVHNSYDEVVQKFLNNFSKAEKKGIIDDAWAAGYPEWFARGNFFEELLGQTRFKNWDWTGDISSTFPGVDFARQVAGKDVAASLKTTTTIDVNNWMAVPKNTTHLNRLRDGKVAGEFVQGDNIVLAELVELHIYVPKANFSQSMESMWINTIGSAYPEIKVIISTIEKEIGL